MLGRTATNAVDGAVRGTILLVGVRPGPGRLAADSVAQAEAVVAAADAVHLGEMRARVVGERIAQRAAP
jgi:hypothetical protein